MGYFSNGTEHRIYESRYCDHCVHQDGIKGSGCSVMLAHLMYNDRFCNDAESPLDVLIPRSRDGLGNEQCTMFSLKGVPPVTLEWDKDNMHTESFWIERGSM